MLKTILFLLLTWLLSFGEQSQYKEQFEKIDELLESLEVENKPGMAIAVNKGNQTIYKNYAGIADLEHGIHIKKDTKFLIASVSKQFTAFAITLLADEEKLSFNDDVHKHIPDLPVYKYPISIMNLLNHTSGLRDADDLNGIIGVGLSDYDSFKDVYQLILQQQELNFKPGTQYDYSNSGYVLLAKIVENVSGITFREFMDTRVFTPLGMKNTLVYDNPYEIIGNKAIAYFSNDGENHSTNNLFSAVYGSTGIRTTLDDLNLWAINFTSHQIGNHKIFNQMKTQGTLVNGETISYALGQEIKKHKGHQAIFHGGGQGAYRAYLLRFPESELSITLLSNSSYLTSSIVGFAYEIADLFLEVKHSPKEKAATETKTSQFEPIQVDTKTLQKYVGNYQIQPGLIFTLKINNNNLELFITGNDKAIPLAARSDNDFVLMDSDNGYHMVFNIEDQTQSQSINYFQFDMEYIGKRVSLVDFDHANIQWQELEGLYYSMELNTVYSLKHNGKNLIATHARNLPINLTPHQPDVYYGDATFFQEIEFIREENNKVTHMLVSGSRSKNINFRKM